MKVIVEYEFYSAGAIDQAIANCDHLEASHIKEAGCKNSSRCDELRELCWLRATLKSAKAQAEKAEYHFKEETP
jgi:hypothetical protein